MRQGRVIECLQHVRFDIWNGELLAFVSSAPTRALHVSCAVLLGGKFTYELRQMNIVDWSARETHGSSLLRGFRKTQAGRQEVFSPFNGQNLFDKFFF